LNPEIRHVSERVAHQDRVERAACAAKAMAYPLRRQILCARQAFCGTRACS